jgi:hypothetical protein
MAAIAREPHDYAMRQDDHALHLARAHHDLSGTIRLRAAPALARHVLDPMAGIYVTYGFRDCLSDALAISPAT